MFLVTGPESILRGPNLKRKVFKLIFCGQNEENISHHVTKIVVKVFH